MMFKIKNFMTPTLVILLFFTSLTANAESPLNLVNMLTSQLGVSNEQASGGAGALFSLARDKLSGDDYKTVSEGLPGVNDLIRMAPDVSSSKSSSGLGGLGGMVSSLGGGKSSGLGSLGNLASLAGSFSSLGLDANMISKFVPIVLQYAQSEGGQQVFNLLKGVLQPS